MDTPLSPKFREPPRELVDEILRLFRPKRRLIEYNDFGWLSSQHRMILSESSNGSKFLIADAPPSILSVDSKTRKEHLKNYVSLSTMLKGILLFNPDHDILYIQTLRLFSLMASVLRIYPDITAEGPRFRRVVTPLRLRGFRSSNYLAVDEGVISEPLASFTTWQYIRGMGVQELYIIIREYSGDVNPSSAQLIPFDLDNSSILVEMEQWNAITSVVQLLEAMKVDNLGHPLPSMKLHYVKQSSIDGDFSNSAGFSPLSENQYRKTIKWLHGCRKITMWSHEAQEMRILEKYHGNQFSSHKGRYSYG